MVCILDMSEIFVILFLLSDVMIWLLFKYIINMYTNFKSFLFKFTEYDL